MISITYSPDNLQDFLSAVAAVNGAPSSVKVHSLPTPAPQEKSAGPIEAEYCRLTGRSRVNVPSGDTRDRETIAAEKLAQWQEKQRIAPQDAPLDEPEVSFPVYKTQEGDEVKPNARMFDDEDDD